MPKTRKTRLFTCCLCGGTGCMTEAHIRQREIDGLGLFCGVCRKALASQRAIDNARLRGDLAVLAPIRMNGCTLTATWRGRCRDYLTCSHYGECLDAVSDKNWSGWTACRND